MCGGEGQLINLFGDVLKKIRLWIFKENVINRFNPLIQHHDLKSFRFSFPKQITLTLQRFGIQARVTFILIGKI